MQEVDHYRQFYEPELEKLGYKSVISQIREDKDYVTNLIAYKTDKFELIKQH